MNENDSDLLSMKPPVPLKERADRELFGDPLDRPGLGDDQKAVHEAILREPEHWFTTWPNVVGVGVGVRMNGGRVTGEPCVTFFVSRKVAADRLDRGERIPREVEGQPTDVVELHAPPRPAQCQRRGLAQDDPTAPQRSFPIQGGIDIGPFDRATRGTACNVFDGDVLVTNAHVVSSGVVVQPGVGQPGGPIVAFNELGSVDLATYVVPGLLSGTLIAHLDGARISLNVIARNHPNAPRVARNRQCTSATVRGLVPPFPGQPVRKSGARTGVTFGTVVMPSGIFAQSFIGSVTPASIPLSALPTTLIGGIGVAFLNAANGDSGSLIGDQATGGFSGLLWGDLNPFSFFNDPLNVLLWLGVSL